MPGDRETRRVPTGPGTGPELVEREVRSFIERLSAPPAALGVAVPGLVDENGWVTGCDTFPHLEGWRAEEAFADLGYPVMALNDADTALAEETCDLRSDATAVLVLAGTWIGTAARANGGPLRGVRGWAGEFGCAPLGVEGGGVARLDELAGGGAVARRLDTDGAGAHERAVRGDPDALAAAREAGEALGLGLATLVNLLTQKRWCWAAALWICRATVRPRSRRPSYGVCLTRGGCVPCVPFAPERRWWHSAQPGRRRGRHRRKRRCRRRPALGSVIATTSSVTLACSLTSFNDLPEVF